MCGLRFVTFGSIGKWAQVPVESPLGLGPDEALVDSRQADS